VDLVLRCENKEIFIGSIKSDSFNVLNVFIDWIVYELRIFWKVRIRKKEERPVSKGNFIVFSMFG